ncbi:tRNA (adenosine(37)-N6)-threonylcarbamoyltransferase complex dimerization subunit type 1 TsaB [Sphingobium nicotianae]|uniref:tRNA (Adenosine(37)-N6)-threonylcarbamoyltransferase complex dimerization subunit type 1 TsaB n=1 Tax=Sphingobium nicotianae TaxID=2782607 RepID=A0A9X1DCP5_9SPHN|nr:tRNA (adenosine(37)-N6)-threonylcarbamoyltransferase complex dimerization subunit type 1 TsaB [Sphingobium nicotianae]MBT2187586.1 tRNA (adenosine(37)-N6)-threonylcarbamoyltransferase complex dimerization subunit type 1 TsaB [Sphingobium nicotianae]
MNERLLIIDCATPMLSLALFDDAHCIASHHEELGRGHAEALLPRIAALPGGGRCDRILVDVGPGSFTGVRVGLAAATGLGFAWQVPVQGYGCLDLIAAMARARHAPAEPFAVVMVGGHGELFWALNSDDGPLTVQSSPIAQLADQIDASLLVGSGAQILIDAGARGRAIPLLPDARDVLLLPDALRALPPRPVYGRGADAKPMAGVSPGVAAS